MSKDIVDTNYIIFQLAEEIKKEKSKLEDILEILNKNVKSLEEYWNTSASEEFFNSFVFFKEKYNEVLSHFDDDIKFLENTVVDSFIAFEQSSEKKINEDIAV